MTLKSILTAAALGVAGFVLATTPSTVRAETKKAAEKKCDAAGKECKSGKDCKVENCKPAEPKVEPKAATPPVAPPEKKCDAKGKECKEGKDCKAENCKPATPK